MDFVVFVGLSSSRLEVRILDIEKQSIANRRQIDQYIRTFYYIILRIRDAIKLISTKSEHRRSTSYICGVVHKSRHASKEERGSVKNDNAYKVVVVFI